MNEENLKLEVEKRENKESKNHRELISFIESDYLEKISTTEYKLFLAIRQGDKLFASRCFDKLSKSYFELAWLDHQGPRQTVDMYVVIVGI